MLEKLGISDDDLPQFDNFDQLKLRLAEIFSEKTRDEWSEIFDETDACVAPVLDKEETGDHYHNKARGSFLPSGNERDQIYINKARCAPTLILSCYKSSVSLFIHVCYQLLTLNAKQNQQMALIRFLASKSSVV